MHDQDVVDQIYRGGLGVVSHQAVQQSSALSRC
jgi:hypothetical protein